MSAQHVLPRKWTEPELDTERRISAARAKLDLEGRGPDTFYEICEQVESEVRDAIQITSDLAAVTGQVVRADPTLWQVLRYLCAPPISEEDLWTLVGRKFKKVPADAADDVAKTFTSLLDRRRFPWLDLRRAPSDHELALAAAGTVVLLAHERLKTAKRKTSSKAQELVVSTALQSAGWSLAIDRSAIEALDMLSRGTFSRERKVAGAKCDVPVRLHDGRLLALECKVSMGPKNSWKRLAREIGGKADRWREVFGTQVVTGAVLSGVYDLRNLLTVQESGVFLFWEHDLTSLLGFVNSAR